MNTTTNNSAHDYTPRVVHFDESFSELEISASENLLWPCFAWKAAIPVRSKSRLDPFEELVLRLSGQGMHSAREIASFCYSPPDNAAFHSYEDLFLFVQSRLSSHGFLDSRFEITDQGKKLIDTWENEGGEYKPAIVYQDGINGGLLSIINGNPPEYAEIVEREGHRITFKRYTTDKGIRAAFPDVKLQLHRKPAGSDVMRVLKEFSKCVTRYGRLRKTALSLLAYDSSGSPEVQDAYDLVYIHCQILVRPGFSDFLVSDGFGLGYSVPAADYISRQNWEWLTELKKKAFIDSAVPSVPKITRFSPIAHGLNSAEKAVKKWKDKAPASLGEGKEKIQNIQDAVSCLYDALEHTFAALCLEYPSREWIDFFSNNRSEQNKKIIEGSALALGFTVTEENSCVLNAMPGAFRETENGAVELHPLLARTIITARHNSSHPCNMLAKELPCFFDLVNEFTKRRNSLKHGDYLTEIDVDELERYYTNVRRTVELCYPRGLPVERTELAVVVNAAEAPSDYGQLRMKAEVGVEDYFKRRLYDLMDADLREVLYRLFMPQYDNLVTVVDCASALQIALYSLTAAPRVTLKPEFTEWMNGFASARNSATMTEEVKKYAAERAIQFGLLPGAAELPASIATVNESRVCATLRGGKLSLQAQCLAMLALISDEVLTAVSKEIPDLLLFTDKIAQIRRHGNISKVDDKAVEEIREKALETIKQLLEVTLWQK
jgi:hypothetical protein